MKIYRKSKIRYESFSEESRNAEEKACQVADTFNQSKIRPNRSKEISDLALSNGIVVGSTMSEWTMEHQGEKGEKDFAIFSFDVAVKPKYRNFGLIGPKLIERAIQKFLSERSDWEAYSGNKAIMRLEVVNDYLADYLIKRYGFKVESRLADRVFLVYQK